jgi:signal transduction histidine kinase
VRPQPTDVDGETDSPHLNGKNGSGSTGPGLEDALKRTIDKKAGREDLGAGHLVAPATTPVNGDHRDNTQTLLADLRAQVDELSAFSHTVAHDLKNPLSILLGFADVLAHDYAESEDEVLDQAIRVIIENGRRIENIINELLLLAEVRTVEEIPVLPLDMAAVVAVANRRLSNLGSEYNAEIIGPKSWPPAMGHQPWVEEVWVNYLSNAIKYGGSSPRVEVGGELTDDGMVRFWIRDFGPGIDPADQLRLFIPFSQLQQANTKGHGLGLSIVQRIVKRLGGTVGVESEVGEGSLFWFTLPAMPGI